MAWPAKLGLAPAPAPWHTNRLAVTALGDALAALTDAFGKIAADVLFLSRPELAELAEPRAAGTRRLLGHAAEAEPGAVRADPQRRAVQAPALAGAAAPGRRQLQRRTPRRRLAHRMAGPAQAAAARPRCRRRSCANSPKGCRSSRRRCAATWTSSGPLLLSEAVTAVVAPLLDQESATTPGTDGNGASGSSRLQAVVDATLQAPQAEQAATYPGCSARPCRPSKLPDAQLEALSGPGQLPGPGTRHLPQHPWRLPGLGPNPTLWRNQSVSQAQRSRQSCCPRSGRWASRPLLVVGPSLGTSSVLWERSRRPARRRLRRRRLGPARARRLARRLPKDSHVAELADAVVDLVDSIAPGAASTTPESPWAGPPVCNWASTTATGSRACPCSAPGAKLGTPEGWLERAETVRAQGTPVMIQGSAAALVRARLHGPPARDQQPAPARPARRRPLQLRLLLRGPGRLRCPRPSSAASPSPPRPSPARRTLWPPPSMAEEMAAGITRRRRHRHRRRRWTASPTWLPRRRPATSRTCCGTFMTEAGK